ncbi:conjugal transfer protein TraN [Acinetobacter sp. ANC 5380]|uniref:Conjugal transfer protein TraN n=2 Tax=Acinetobacter terrae TaxID=2731247 RepID=A0A7Y2WAB5_9GAMM|nr:conjugal transfer protein TraN [Acinetobacter terrae]
MNKILRQSLLAVGMLLSSGAVFAGINSSSDALTCTYTTKFKDTFKAIRQDRPVTINHTENSFSFGWWGRENYTDASWEFEVDLTNAIQVQVFLTYVRYDDNMYIYVNEREIFGRVGGGTSGFNTNVDVGRYFIDGVNKIRVRLLNNIPSVGEINAVFKYSEGGCVGNPVVRPPVPKLQDLQRCVVEDICTQPSETRKYGGVDVKRDCWQYTTVRTCYDFLENTETCKVTPQDGGSCEVVSKQCLDEKSYTVGSNEFKGCTLYETKTRCTKPIALSEMTQAELLEYNKENESRQLACKPIQTCVGDDCYIQNSERDSPDQDMPYVLALLEIGNQAGTYMDPNNIRLFDGVQNKCRSRRGFRALAQCCSGGGGSLPKAKKSSGQDVVATGDNVYADLYEKENSKFDDSNGKTNADLDYAQGGGNPYTYDSLYAPNEARYMLQGFEATTDSQIGQTALQNGGSSKITVMGYGYSPTGSATGDQVSFGEYSQNAKSGTTDD